jgi:hypothetical protein
MVDILDADETLIVLISSDPASPLKPHDLPQDPAEAHQIASRHPDLVRELDA